MRAGEVNMGRMSPEVASFSGARYAQGKKKAGMHEGKNLACVQALHLRGKGSPGRTAQESYAVQGAGACRSIADECFPAPRPSKLKIVPDGCTGGPGRPPLARAW